MRNKKGFTLVEIMIVVAIIALLAAIAIPNLLRARVNANESVAITTLQTLSTALQSFRSVTPLTGFPATLAGLAPAGVPPYVDATLAVAGVATRQGYNFTYTPGAADATGVVHQYWISADPITPNVTGVRFFYIDEGGVACGGAATAGAHAAAGAACGGATVALQ